MASSDSEDSSHAGKAPGNSKPYDCTLCSVKCESLTAILEHIKSHSRDKPWECGGCQNDSEGENSPPPHDPDCPGGWEDMDELVEDCEIPDENSTHKCTLCPFTSSRLYEIVSHIQLHVRKRQNANDLLEVGFVSSQRDRDNIYTCTECEFSCVRPDKLETHMALHAPGATLECKHCGIGVESLKELRKHTKTHELDRPFGCPVCPSRFTRADNMKLHMASHLGDTQYFCRFCDYVTTNKTRIHQHYRTHKKNELKMAASSTKANVGCPVCSRAFASYPLLMFHIKAHSLRPPFRCPLCEMSFTSGDEAQEHYADHVESVALSCAYCNFKCFDDSTIHNHLGTQHGSQKPFQCELCDYRFSSFPHWKRHQLVHSGEKPFECEICGARFCQSGNRKAHMIKLHGYFTPLPRGRHHKQLEEITTPHSVQRNSDIFTKLHAYMKEGKFTDVYFIIGDAAVGAHKAVLASSSKVFQAMFESEMKESLTQEVVISDVDVETFRVFLDYVYTKNEDNVGSRRVGRLLMLADKYDVEPLLASCESHIRKTLSTANVLRYLQMSDLYRREDLKKLIISFIKKDMKAVIHTDDWSDLKSKNPRLISAVFQSLLDDNRYLFRLDSYNETNTAFCDAEIEIDGHEFPVDKFILIGKSAQFDRIFQDDPQKGRIDGISTGEFRQLMDYVYFNELPVKATGPLLKAAMDFGLDELTNHVVSLYEDSLRMENAIATVIMASSLQLDSLKSRAMGFVLNHVQQLRNSASWKDLFGHPDLMMEIVLKTGHL